MARDFDLTPRPVPRIETRYRRIVTDFPVPESIPILQKLRQYEPRSMRGQPPVLWNRAEGFQVWDAYGNCWIDWSSGVLITNAGHGRQRIVEAITRQAQSRLLTNYCFPSEIRSLLVEKLASLLPEPLKKVFLLTTGSETIECAIKLARTYGVLKGGTSKHVIVSFEGAFHGRTLGAQQAGGIPELKSWIINLDPGFVQVPFPDGFRTEDTSFALFEKTLKKKGIRPENVCAVLMETYRGFSASFAPVDYIRALREWCNRHDALLVFDEVQAGFGRTGKLFGFEHYGVVPDLACFGKGISSSLPLSAVAGRPDVMDLYDPGTMTSTHTGNPVCCAATLASIETILEENLVENAAQMGKILHEELQALAKQFPQIGCVHGKGLVAGVSCVLPGTKEPDGDLAFEAVYRSVTKGVLMFSPVGLRGSTIKINPPLCINEEALRESLQAFREAFQEAVEHKEVKTA